MSSFDVTKYQIETFDLDFQKHGGKYRIFTSVPTGPAPAEGYPVIYMLDGYLAFPFMQAAQEKAGFCPLVTVGIAYPIDSGIDIHRRYFDLTPVTPQDLCPIIEGRITETGGRDTFFASMETELKPVIEKLAPIDRSRQTMFGHSLGGLFTLYILYNSPASFQSYISADPAVWWSGSSILADHSRFMKSEQAQNGKAPIPLLIETALQQIRREGITDAEVALLAKLRVGPTGKDIAADLRGLPGLHLSYREFANENHGSMIPYAVADALSFALNPEKWKTESPAE